MLSSWTLRRITRDDLYTVMSWVESKEVLAQWAGDALPWPIEGDVLWELLDRDDTLPLVMTTEHDLIAFGQILESAPGMLHLGLLIVGPEFRGRRLGEHISLALFKRGMALWPDATHVTLDVARNDEAALAMSRRLGFEEQERTNDTAKRMRLVHALPALLT